MALTDVIVVGSINVDFVVRTARLPGPGETVTGGRFERHFGGKGANQAVAAARLGAGVALIGAVGDDALGLAALADLRAEGVDAAGVLRLRGQATGAALIVVDDSGENQIAVASGANRSIDGQAVEAGLAKWQSASGPTVMLAVFEVGDGAVIAAARLAAQRGLKLVVNPAPARALPAAVVEAGAIVIANRVEAHALTGASDAKSAGSALSRQTSAPVIVTLGSEGALIADEENVKHMAAPHVEAIDTTGAGDTFVGAFAAELARGSTIDQAVRFAVLAAAVSVSAPGARGGMPTRDGVRAAYPTLGDEDVAALP